MQLDPMGLKAHNHDTYDTKIVQLEIKRLKLHNHNTWQVKSVIKSKIFHLFISFLKLEVFVWAQCFLTHLGCPGFD